MSALNVLSKINKKLDEGWKMSDQSCPMCHTIIMGNPTTKEFFCVKCDMPAKLFADDEEYDVEVISFNGTGNSAVKNTKDSTDSDEVIDKEEEYQNMVLIREAERRKSDQMSKKMGELLLQGWTMLEDACMDCLVPLMRSKKGECVCVGCGPVGQKKENKIPQKEAEKSSNKTMIEEKKIEKNVAQPTKKNDSIPMSQPQKIKEIELKKEAPKEVKKDTKEEKIIKEVAIEPKAEMPPKESISHDSHAQDQSNADMFQLGKFEKSIEFYSHLTGLLKKEMTNLAQMGLINHLDRVKQVVDLQITIDNAKKCLLSNITNQQ